MVYFTYLDTLITFIRNAKFLGNFVIVSSYGDQFLFNLALGGGKANVDVGEFVNASDRFFILKLNGSLTAEGLRKIK